MSEQLPASTLPQKLVQCDGGLGSRSGDGGSLNFGPAYALPDGDGDRGMLDCNCNGGGVILTLSAGLSLD